MNTDQAIKHAGLYSGIIGSFAFMAFALVFLQDWANRFQYVAYLMPVPMLILLFALKRPLLGGLMLIVTGFGALGFDMIFSPAHPGEIAGRGLGYTLVFVALPLLISGGMFLFTWWKSYQSKK